MSSIYQNALRSGQEAARVAVLDCAIGLLVEEGIAALTIRRLATEIGTSTKVLYTMFGGKDGLADALYREGFARLRRAQEQVPCTADPLAHLSELGTVYRERALAEPAYYRVMFERAIPGYRPSTESLAVAASAFDSSTEAVAACIEAGVFRPGDAHEISKLFWAAAHGAVSLEIAGHFPPDTAARRYEMLMTAVGRAFLAQPEPTTDQGRTA